MNINIVGGTAANDTEFDDCVAVGSLLSVNDGVELIDWYCSGIIISPNVVLTAGHCFRDGARMRIYIGPDVYDNDNPGQICKVAKNKRHENYAYDGFDHYDNDIWVLVLEQNITSVTPRAIASKEVIDAATAVTAVGYGRTDINATTANGKRNKVVIPYIATHSCSEPGDEEKYGCNLGLELVAGKPDLGLDTCKNDSGGPIYIKTGNDYSIAGITSRKSKLSLNECGDGGIYTRLDKYKPWIDNTSAMLIAELR